MNDDEKKLKEELGLTDEEAAEFLSNEESEKIVQDLIDAPVEKITLNEADSKAFIAEMENPTPSNQALKDAFARHSKNMQELDEEGYAFDEPIEDPNETITTFEGYGPDKTVVLESGGVLTEEIIQASADKAMADEIVDKESPYKSQRERAQERIVKYQEIDESRRVEKAMKRRKIQLKKAADRFHKKREKIRTEDTPQRDLKVYDSAVEAEVATREVTIGAPQRITPDIEKLLFPYFILGSSVRSIHQQFGRKYSFSLQALYTARDFYKWEQRRTVMMKMTRNDSDVQLAERFKDYIAFFDDLMSEAIIRFKDNSDKGQNTNPFNNLKVTNIKDLRDLMEMMTTMTNGGVKKYEINNKNKVNIKFSDAKANKILAALADEDEEDDEDYNE